MSHVNAAGVSGSAVTPIAHVSRECRVLCLLAALVLLSVLDLHNTLVYLRSIGMVEGNPLARWVMRANSPLLLIGFKTLTITVAGIILYRLRRTAAAEIGAFLCVAVLAWLTVRWNVYTDEMLRVSPSIVELTQAQTGTWSRITH